MADDVRIESVGELPGFLLEFSDFNPGWFRGHSNSAWELVPSFYRTAKSLDEQFILKKFKQQANLLLDRVPLSDFDWLFWMQHYGVPTRLLDWTESPLAALYFAVEDETSDDYDGAVWVFDPVCSNKDNNNFDGEEFFLPSFEDEILKNYSPGTYAAESRSLLNPMAAIATRNNPRIQAQLGVFTIFHRDGGPLERKANAKDWSKKVLIPKENKKEIRSQLSILRIDRFSMFPELSSVGQNIREEFGA